QRIPALRPAGQLSAVQNRSRRFCRSRAAPTNTNPSPAPAILVRNAGYCSSINKVCQRKRAETQRIAIKKQPDVLCVSASMCSCAVYGRVPAGTGQPVFII
ncbi:MAG TPA: hypothetical protein VIM41_15685, partial [Gammaproteobacteria bacterium]